MARPKVRIKRVYDAPTPDDGFRLLVDRIWPRGLSKEKAALDLWLPHVAPSTDLRKWFGHDEDRLAEFTTRYRAELDANPAMADLTTAISAHPLTTLLFGAHDPRLSQAQVLLEYLVEHHAARAVAPG